jgi:cytoskeletal protein CcmA (bactofilin family)
MHDMSQPPSPSPAPAPQVAAPGSRPNFLSEDIEIKGTLKFQGNLTSNGHIDGSVIAGGTLTVGSNGEVKGDIQANAVSIHGTVNGNITVRERCELRGDAELLGDLDAPRLVIEEGVTLVGNVRVQPRGDGAGQPRPPVKP